MADEIPLYFTTPFDENEVVDVDEEFSDDINESSDDQTDDNAPPDGDPDIKDVVESEPIVPDPPESDLPEDLDEAIAESDSITEKDSTSLTDLDESLQDSIYNDITEAKSEVTDTWEDIEGEIYDKLPDVGLDTIAGLTSAMEDILGVVCNTNIKDPSFDVPVFDNIFDDLINNGLLDLMDCLYKESLIDDTGRNIRNVMLGGVIGGVNSGSVNTVVWLDDKLDGTMKDVYGGDFISPLTESMNLPLGHTYSDNQAELDKVTGLFSSNDDNWYGAPPLVSSDDSGTEPIYKLDAFVGVSEGSKFLFASDDQYRLSLVLGEDVIDNGEVTLSDLYPLSNLA